MSNIDIMKQHLFMSYATDLVYLVTFYKNRVRFEYNGIEVISMPIKAYKFASSINNLSETFAYIGEL